MSTLMTRIKLLSPDLVNRHQCKIWTFAKSETKMSSTNYLRPFLAMSIAADHIRLIAFPDNPYLQARGLLSGNVSFAAEFDVLTLEELKGVMEYINHWYQHAHRHSKKSGIHGYFEDFVGDKPFMFFYLLWPQEVPHLLLLAVPHLPESVARERAIVEPLIGIETLDPSRPQDINLRQGSRRKNTQRGVSSNSSALAAAWRKLGVPQVRR